VLDETQAALMLEHAERIGRSLQLGLGMTQNTKARPLGIPIVGGG
jgi:hypothetical protein